MKTILINIFLLLLLLLSCTEEKGPKEPVINQDSLDRAKRIEDSLAVLQKIKDADIWPEIKYQRIVIKNKKMLDSVWREYRYTSKNQDRNRAFITINRKESNLLRVGDTIIVPDSIMVDMRAYSIFPHYFPQADTLSKLILVSNYYQCYAAYENGNLVRFAACNTGKEKTPTYPGRYSLVWRDRIRRSSLDSNWVLPFTFNFHRFAGNAFHQFTMPGYAASHSCVRQFMSDAEWLFNWGKQAKYVDRQPIPHSGTPVIILGVPDYDRKRGGPWTDLKSNKDKRIKLDFEPMGVEEALIPLSQIPEVSRPVLPDYKRYKYAEDTLRARGVIRPHVKLIPSINYNKERREKAAKAKRDSLEKLKQTEKEKTNIELIKKNLELLEGDKQDSSSGGG